MKSLDELLNNKMSRLHPRDSASIGLDEAQARGVFRALQRFYLAARLKNLWAAALARPLGGLEGIWLKTGDSGETESIRLDN